jgi:hypothetical protein
MSLHGIAEATRSSLIGRILPDIGTGSSSGHNRQGVTPWGPTCRARLWAHPLARYSERCDIDLSCRSWRYHARDADLVGVHESFLFGLASGASCRREDPHVSYDCLYKPEPCAPWPVAQLRAVGIAYREAANQGFDGLACLDRAIAAYVAAGGVRSGATRCVLDMIASLSLEEGDWLWGAAQTLRDRHSWADHQADLFGPRTDRLASC